jgi:hypothetical protein
VGADQCGVPGCDWRCNTITKCTSLNTNTTSSHGNTYCNSDSNANRDTDGNSNRDSYTDGYDYSNLNTQTYTNPEDSSHA